MTPPVAVGVFGLGEEGRSLARHLSELAEADLRWVGDPVLASQTRLRPAWPLTRATASFDDLLDDNELEAVVVAVPVAEDRGELVRRALEADKHVLVSVPLALRGDEAELLVRLAARRDRRLLVGNPLLFHPAVRKLRELIEIGRLGGVRYISCERTRRDETRSGVGVVAALGARLVSLALYLLADEPVDVRAWRTSYGDDGAPDVACCFLRFATGAEARFHLSRLDPASASKATVVGARRSAAFDELARERPLTIYEPNGGRRDAGDIVCPQVGVGDPLRLECEYFLAAIASEVPNAGDARRAVAVAETIETLSGTPRGRTAQAAETTGAALSSQVIPLRARRPRR